MTHPTRQMPKFVGLIFVAFRRFVQIPYNHITPKHMEMDIFQILKQILEYFVQKYFRIIFVAKLLNNSHLVVQMLLFGNPSFSSDQLGHDSLLM